MQNRELIKDFGPEEPPQNELRYTKRNAVATQSYLHFGFHAPGVLHPDGPAIELLAFLLSGGKSARMHRHIVERKRSATSASCYYLAYENIGLLMVTAITEAQKIREAATDSWSVLQDLCDNGVSEEELHKIKNKLKLHQAMQTEEALSLAELLSYYEAYGSYERIAEHLQRMQEITSDEIVEAASKYVRINNLSVMEYVNDEVPDVTAEEYRKSLIAGFVPPETNLSPPDVLTTEIAPFTFQTTALPVVREGHATYIFHPDEHYPFLAAGIFFRGGRSEETGMNAGITHLLHRCALKGTSRFSAEQLASSFDGLGNPPRFSCYRDFSGFTFEALPESFINMFDLLLHCLVDAQFPAVEVETEKGKVLSAIRRNMDDNFVRPVQLFHRAFYGEHPYGLPETGFEENIPSMDQELLKIWKKRIWNSKRAVITVVGSFDPDYMFDHLDGALSQMVESAEELQPPPQVKTPVRRSEIEDRPKKQTAFVLGFPCPPAASTLGPRYDALQQVLSGMGGRLFLNLRSKKALAYTVHASAIASLHAGAFVTYIAGEASKEKEALEGMWQELETLKKQPVSQEELENARNGLIGNYTLNTQTAAGRVMDYTNSHILGRPLPYAPVYRDLVHRVTAGELLEISRMTFQAENSAIAIVRGMRDVPETEKMIVAS
jgi:zinc protease